jgi:hypothetical protein
MVVGFLSTLITRGAVTWFSASTFLKNRFAARLLLEALSKVRFVHSKPAIGRGMSGQEAF